MCPCLSLVLVATRRQCEMLTYFLQGEGFAVTLTHTLTRTRTRTRTRTLPLTPTLTLTQVRQRIHDRASSKMLRLWYKPEPEP